MKNIVVVGNAQFTADIEKLISSSFCDCKCETYNDASKALNRVCYNQFNVLISELKLDDPMISGATLARTAYPLGKHTILISNKPMLDKLWISIFHSKLRSTSCIQYDNKNALIKEIDHSLSLNHVDPLEFFQTIID